MRLLLSIILLSLLVLSGCGKLSMENYNKLKMGMEYGEVVKIIGSPDKCSDVMGLRNCEWGDEGKSVNVTFAGEKVIFFTGKGLQ